MPDERDIQIMNPLKTVGRAVVDEADDEMPRAMEHIKDASRKMARKTAERAGAYRKSRRR